IATLLAENAAAPAAIHAPLALLRRGEPPESLPLQLRLRSAIEDSGLFYESHLKRWYQKELPYAQLRRAPQMRLASGVAQANDPAARAALEGERDLRSSELLRPLVRQQLELLSQPVLRWEGEFWNGIDMSLILHFPTQERAHGEAQREQGED